MRRRITALTTRWMRARLTWSGIVTNWLLVFAAASGLIAVLPSDLLDWALFAGMAIVFVTEGEVMRRKVMRNRRERPKWTVEPRVVVIIAVRYVLGAYFLFAVARVLFDPDRAWPDPIAYEARAFVVAWLILELIVAPYTSESRGSIADLWTDDAHAEKEQPA